MVAEMESKAEVTMDEMVCICGETLRAEQISPAERASGKKELGKLNEKFREHMAREDHQSSPLQWKVAYDQNEKAKERAKSSRSADTAKEK